MDEATRQGAGFLGALPPARPLHVPRRRFGIKRESCHRTTLRPIPYEDGDFLGEVEARALDPWVAVGLGDALQLEQLVDVEKRRVPLKVTQRLPWKTMCEVRVAGQRRLVRPESAPRLGVVDVCRTPTLCQGPGARAGALAPRPPTRGWPSTGPPHAARLWLTQADFPWEVEDEVEEA